jgi:hypothetical protein
VRRSKILIDNTEFALLARRFYAEMCRLENWTVRTAISRASTAEVAILSPSHIRRKILPDAPAFGVDDSGPLQSTDFFSGAPHRRRVKGVLFRCLIFVARN